MFEKELSVAKEVAIEAGKIVLTYYGGDIEVELKNKREPVTKADKASNEFITGKLAELFPDDGILAEESKDDKSRMQQSRVWIVDPMDGTKEFIDKVGQFAVMVGLAVDGVPVLGVVYQPTTDMLLYAVKGQGAYSIIDGKEERAQVSGVDKTSQMRMVISRSHRSHLVDSIKEDLGIEKEVASGSVGLKVGLLIQQKSDLYMHPNSKTKEWDTAAPQIILEEAGGVITDCWGEPLKYNKANVFNDRGFVASNGVCHSEVLDKMERHLVDMD